MSIRSSLLKLLAILSALQTNIVPYTTRKSKVQGAIKGVVLESSDGVFDLLRECFVVVAGQDQRFSKGDPDGSGLRHPPRVMQNLVEPFDADRDDRHAEPRRNHPDPGTEPPDLAGVTALTLGKDQHREAILEHLSDVPHPLARAGSALGEGERVEEQRRQIVIEAVGEPCSAAELIGEEVGLEELLRHRRR